MLKRLLETEPVVIAGVVRVVLAAAVAWGFQATAEQVAATVIAVEAVSGLLVRAAVSPVDRHGNLR